MNDNSQKLVSIIISAYNAERYLAQSIESAIRQTYQHIEIIIVNDGSTDTTLNMLEAYAKKDNRIIIINQANQGPSAARNTGFKKAKGDYLCILDADDIMLPIKIESQLIFMEQAPLVDFSYSKVYYFMDGTDTIYRHDLATVSGSHVYEKLLQYGNFIYTSTVFFRRSVFDLFGGFDESLRSAEEFDYWLTLAQHGVTFLHQDSYLTLCRSRQDGLTSDSVTMYTAAVAVFEKYLNHSKHPVWAKITSYQYLKNRSLLFISRARKIKSKNVKADTPAKTNFFSPSYYVNKFFVLMRKIKFWLVFKKIHTREVEHYLSSIESPQKS